MAQGVSARRPSDAGAKLFAGKTDVGCVREHNEDSIVVAPPLYVVCDGMGGHAAGEVASSIAAEVIRQRAPHHVDADALGQAVEEANLAIMKAAHEGYGRDGMGTTCTAAMLEEDKLVIAQVGDSRAYLLSKNTLQQLTRDHSLMADLIEAGRITPEQARTDPKRSIITRALGSDARTRPDLFEISVAAGDRLLLCSDGLTTMLTDDEIQAVMIRESDPEECAQKLLNRANAAGGYDNISVIVVDVVGSEARDVRKTARKTKRTAVLLIAVLLALFVGAGALFGFFVSHSAYLAVQDGKVALYSGLQGDVFGITTGKLVRVTDIDVDELPPGVANRLSSDGIRADSLEAAENLISQYEEEARQYRETNGIVGSDGEAGSSVDTDGATGAEDGREGDADSDVAQDDGGEGNPSAPSTVTPATPATPGGDAS